jgi:xylulose-5-phosphate/fructose-6-phosphate phosphoketolase
VIALLPGLAARAASAHQTFRDKLVEHEAFIRRRGRDMPEVADWRWGG